MSMQVSGSEKYYRNDYLEKLQEMGDKAKEMGNQQAVGNRSEGMVIPKDEYISSEKSGARPSGLYHMEQDGNGNRRVLYDDPKKPNSRNENGNGRPETSSGSREDDVEKCTANTDKVDREIEKLKEQKQQLEQQIRAAFGDEEKRRELEMKLEQIERELSQKDNDTYRRQHLLFMGSGNDYNQ